METQYCNRNLRCPDNYVCLSTKYSINDTIFKHLCDENKNECKCFNKRGNLNDRCGGLYKGTSVITCVENLECFDNNDNENEGTIPR